MPLYALNDHAPAIADPARIWIAPGAHVIGKVTLGIDVNIWFGAALRGDNEPIAIGDGTNIQENAVLHTDPGFPAMIGANCTIGHKAIVHGCTIGDGTLVGMGAMVMNGAKVGKNCLIGAGALITEGKEFPDNMLIVGAPARPLRELDAAMIARLQMAAQGYVLKGRNYRANLRELPA